MGEQTVWMLTDRPEAPPDAVIRLARIRSGGWRIVGPDEAVGFYHHRVLARTAVLAYAHTLLTRGEYNSIEIQEDE